MSLDHISELWKSFIYYLISIGTIQIKWITYKRFQIIILCNSIKRWIHLWFINLKINDCRCFKNCLNTFGNTKRQLRDQTDNWWLGEQQP